MNTYLVIFTNHVGDVGPDILLMSSFEQASAIQGYPEYPRVHVIELTIGRPAVSGYENTGVLERMEGG